MAHSITVLKVHGGARAGEILDGLAERLDVHHIGRDGAGSAQLWLQFDPEHAYDAVVTALDETATDWRDSLTVVGPHDEVAEVA